MKKIIAVAIMMLTAAGIAQAENWSGATSDWNSTNAWDSGVVPNGSGAVANIDSAPNPDLGGNTITLGRAPGGASWSLITTGAGNRIFSNGGLKIERTFNAQNSAGGDITLSATGVSSFGVPIELTRTTLSPDSRYLRIRLSPGANQVTFVEPITWSNTQLQLLNQSNTGTGKMILVKNTVTGSTPGKSLWASSDSVNTRITFQGAVSATTNNVEFQVAAGDGRIIFDNGSGAVADSSLSLLRFFGGTLQVNNDDQVATDVIESGTATWNLNGNNNQNTGSLRLNGGSTNTFTVDFSNAAAESLWFADSSSEAWATNDILDLTGFVFDTDALRFGTDANGLTATQLGQIRVDGAVVDDLGLDSSGYLAQIPQPPPAVGLIDIQILPGGTNMALSWSNSVGLSYAVETNIDLVAGDWGIVQSNLTGTGSSISYTGSTFAAQNFYRVIVK